MTIWMIVVAVVLLAFPAAVAVGWVGAHALWWTALLFERFGWIIPAAVVLTAAGVPLLLLGLGVW